MGKKFKILGLILLLGSAKAYGEFEPAVNLSENSARSLAPDVAAEGSNVYVTGISEYTLDSFTTYDYLTIKYKPNGDTAWTRCYNGTGNSYNVRIIAQGQTFLDPHTQPKFVNPLPRPSVAQPTTSGGTHYEVSITQFRQDLGLINIADSTHYHTTVWGYGGTYPGPTIEARKRVPITVRWNNELTDSLGNPLPHLFQIDTTRLWANPPGWPASGIPTVTHLHGAHTESASDGLSEAWYTPAFAQRGVLFVKQTYVYDNTQDAATLWYHDHALGISRLSINAGLAGFYLLRSDEEDALNLPKGEYEIPLLIQDRMFTSDGELYYPLTSFMTFGGFVLVNGMTWPKLDVEPRKYRFRILNGSDSRFYHLWLELQDTAGVGPSFNQIGTDGGLLDAPVALDSLLIAPAERRDVVVDFSNFLGKKIILRNDARIFFPLGPLPDLQTDGQVMMIQVDSIPVTDSSSLPTNLRPSNPIVKIDTASASTSRVLIVNDLFVGTLSEGWKKMNDPVTETPKLNTTEIWEVMNLGAFAHPIHLHLVQFQLIDHQYCSDTSGIPGKPSDLVVSGPKFLPKPDESGWKDTQIMYPHELTRVIARFDREGLYMWHCHILSHEDMNMMRPYEVQAANPCTFKPGDSNGDFKVSFVDILYAVNYVFKNGRVPLPLCRGDVNDDGKVNLADIIYIANYLSKRGPTPIKSGVCCL